MNFFKRFSNDIGIDLGTSSVLIYVKDKGIVLKEPSVVAVDLHTGKLAAVGEEARRMLGRAHEAIQVVRPLSDGVISDYDLTEQMLKYFIARVTRNKFFKPRVMICVPSGVTEVEQRAVRDAALQAGAKKVKLIEEPLAAAIGADLDISRPRGIFVIDIGGGTTDIATISLSDIVISKSIKTAGDEFDNAVIDYVKKQYSLQIGVRTAEEVKCSIGCVYPRPTDISIEIRGGSILTGLPQTIQVRSEEIRYAFEPVVQEIISAVKEVLENTPPELIGDILEDGALITGGGGLVYGLDKRLSDETCLNIRVAEDPVSCVAKGAGAALEHLEVANDTIM